MLKADGLETPNRAVLPLLAADGTKVGTVTIAPLRGASIWQLSEPEAQELGEAPVQVVEQAVYEYRLDADPALMLEPTGLVRPSVLDAGESHRAGTLDTGSNAGRLELSLVNHERSKVARAVLEVRSSRLDYRTEYRAMLDDIAQFSTGLLLDLAVPTAQVLRPDGADEPDLVAQAFFLLHLLGSDEFEGAVGRILAAPITAVSEEIVETESYRRIQPSYIAASLASRDRLAVPESHPLRSKGRHGIEVWPRTMLAPTRVPTRDTPENRFVKWVLKAFATIADDLARRLKDARASLAAAELIAGARRAASWADHPALAEVGDMRQVPIATPAMQRRPGYREILRAWIAFNSMARLHWDGLADTFTANRRNLSELYEYWAFLQLLEIVRQVFSLEPAEGLVTSAKDGLRLSLRRGVAVNVTGRVYGERRLRVMLSYNRGFPAHADRWAQGSWTLGMCPDYTLSFWPDEMTEETAESVDLAVHIHFDAKYKVDTIQALFGSGEDGDTEDATTLEPKRVDILKMHAYRDAIRRSEGAYVLFPGAPGKTQTWIGFRELLPGLGAFPLRPKAGGADGLTDLRKFIEDAALLLSDRAAAREQLSYDRWTAATTEPRPPLRVDLPEIDHRSGLRSLPPMEASVVIATVSDPRADWIGREGRLPLVVPIGGDLVTPGPFTVDFALLQGDSSSSVELWQVLPGSGRVVAGAELAAQGYPEADADAIFVVHEVDLVPTGAGWPLNSRAPSGPQYARLDAALAQLFGSR